MIAYFVVNLLYFSICNCNGMETFEPGVASSVVHTLAPCSIICKILISLQCLLVRGKVINLRVPLDLKGNKDLSTEYGS